MSFVNKKLVMSDFIITADVILCLSFQYSTSVFTTEKATIFPLFQ